MKSFTKVLKIIGNCILWLFVLFAVVVTVLVFSAQNNGDGLSNIAGKSLVNVLSDSMNPTFKKGDLIFDKILTGEEKSSCKKGDIITYYTDLNGDGNDEINTHRIVEVYEESGYTYYVTKGDNKDTNSVNDSNPVISTKVLGKYTGKRLASAGNVISFLQTSTGFLCVIVIPLIVFFLFELYRFISILIKVRSKGKVTAADEEEIKRRAIEEYIKQQNSASNGETVPSDENSINNQ